MNKPGADIRTRTINIPGVIKELQNNLEVRLKKTLEDWDGDDNLREYLQQDLETYNGSLELMYHVGFIDKDRWDAEWENGFNLYNNITRNKTA